ncbi:hypothetical protein QT970_13545 [Microcoleus sp. herbarium8]|uniref:hypothetical protein n=1 Tax=Microcoleus sp. herbarium8 TaxID=3055436 RepID=UPI002FD1BF18
MDFGLIPRIDRVAGTIKKSGQIAGNWQRPCLCCSSPCKPFISFAHLFGSAIRDRTEFIFSVFSRIAEWPVITDGSSIL